MNNIEIKVEILSDPKGRKFQVDGIPEEVWNSFVKRSQELRPDVEPGLAWAALFADIVDAVADVDSKCILLREIPKKTYDAFGKICEAAGTTITGFFIEMIRAAESDKFFLGRYAQKRTINGEQKTVRGRNVIVLAGITEAAIKPFTIIANQFKVSIPGFFCRFFEQVEEKAVSIRTWQEDQSGEVVDASVFDIDVKAQSEKVKKDLEDFAQWRKEKSEKAAK